jgi:hypothetical protein
VARARLSWSFTLCLPFVLLGAVFLRTQPEGPLGPSLWDSLIASWTSHRADHVGAAGGTPSELKDGAAALLEARVAKGGNGFTFEIVQRSTLQAKPSGPKIEVPDPDDRYTTIALADSYELGSLIERGAVSPDGFWMEMRTGPDPGQTADWTADDHFGTIARDGKVWRDDGDGWYETADPPGIGLDPVTAARLPALLRNAADARDDGSESVAGVSSRRLEATGRIADVPGILAADGAPFTTIVAPVEFSFDEDGRLVRVHILARNDNQKTFDLLVDTVITFAYPGSPPDIPEPAPAYDGPVLAQDADTVR